MANEKYALLDTDFISKMHLIRKDDHNKLIDKIMAMPGYCFYCHKQIQVEIMRHNIAENLDRIPAEAGGDLYLINGNMTKLEDAGIFAADGGRKSDDDVPEQNKGQPPDESGQQNKKYGGKR